MASFVIVFPFAV